MAVGPFTLTNPGLLAHQDGSIDPESGTFFAVLQLDAAGAPDLTEATYANLTNLSAGDAAPVDCPLEVTGAIGTVKVDQSINPTDFGAAVNISARYYWLVQGAFGAPAGGDLILGFMDLNDAGAGDVSSINSDFKVSANAANGLYQVTKAP